MEQPPMDPSVDATMDPMDPPAAPPLRITTDILTRAHDHAPDSPTTTLITTLRDELLTLTDHAAVLNAKLVASLDRAATLEDEVYQHTAAERRKDEQILQLERAKAQWEESMRTGLLVERKVVKDEMQRLVEGLVEEERRRGSAEEGRARVEREVDDLSATLFEQANTMVAAERMARAQAETRLAKAEENLQAAETAMRDMQHHLQSLPALLPAADLPRPVRRYNTTHVPYAEFVAFVQHLRTHRPRKSDGPPPALSTLLTQPFLARAQTEDVDPSLRLDVAPDLSWLTRRAVIQAILAGDLVIEPVSVATLCAGKEYAAVHPADIACSMCGKHVVPRPKGAPTEDGGPLPPRLASAARNSSTSRFSLKPFFSSPSASPSPSPAGTPRPQPTTLFIFRITTLDPAASDARMYPLCASGWCLARLRAVCEWWRFVRVCMVDVVWRGDDAAATAGGPVSKRGSVNGVPGDTAGDAARAPELPPRRKSSGWSLGFKTLGGGRGLGLTSKPGSPTSGGRADDAGHVEGTETAPAMEDVGAEETAGEGPEQLVGAAQQEEAPVEEPASEIAHSGEPAGEVPAPEVLAAAETTAEEPERQETAVEETAHTVLAAEETSAEETAAPSSEATADGHISSAASETSENPNAFSTPQTSSAPLSPERNPHAATDVAAHENSIDLSSPRGSIIDETARGDTDATLPPTPTRPARRAVPVPPGIAPAIPERSRARPVSLTLDTKVADASDMPITPDPATASSVVTPTPVRPPALPSRLEKRVSLVEEKQDVDEEEVDSWETKTWREVVRLKEDMWKARVGVSDQEAT